MKNLIPALLLSLVALSSQTQAAEIDPKLAAYYAPDKVVEVEIFTSQWDNMKNQDPRGGRCNFAFIGDRYDWFHFEEIRVNGTSFHDVGVKKKSWCGSESKGKPSLNIKFDKFNDPQGKIAEDALGTDALTLNNSIQDPAYVRQCLAYQMFAKVGIPTPLCNFAHLRVNGQDMGLYVNLQPMKKDFLKSHYGKDLGNVYEMALENFEPFFRDRFAASLDSMKKEEDTSLNDINALMDAVSDDRGSLAKIEALVDLDQYFRFWSMEILLNHWDSFSLGGNNTYVYFPANGKMQLLPWGTDQVLMAQGDREARNLYAGNRLPRKLSDHPVMLQRLRDTLASQMANQWNENEMIASIDRTANAVRRFIPGNEQGRFNGELEGLKWNIRERRNQINGLLNSGIADQMNIRLQNAKGNRFCLNTQTFSANNKVTNYWGCGEHQDQRWDVIRIQGDFVRLRNPASGNCVNLQGDAEGTNVNAWTCERHPDQTWMVRQMNGTMLFESQRAPGKCLSLGQEVDGANAIIKNCNPNDASQNWRRI